MPLNIIHKEDIFCDNSQKNQRTNSNVNYEIGDVQLWQEFQSGSEKAYATIYKNNVSLLYSYGLKLVHNKDLVKMLKHYMDPIMKLAIYPGEDEMKSLAEGTMRVLEGQEQVKLY